MYQYLKDYIIEGGLRFERKKLDARVCVGIVTHALHF